MRKPSNLGNATTGNVSIVSGGTTALSALPNGNVGIGTTAPASLLSVGNTSQFQVNSSGAIAAATGIISSGTIQFSALGTGVVQSSSNGTLSSAALNLAGGTQYISGILPVINGGSPFEETNGAITERIPTEDLLLGGTATASSKFAFTNVNSGTPTASISGANNNALSLTATGNLGTTNAQTLQLGNATTGNITLAPNGTAALTALGNGNVGIGTTAPANFFSVGPNSEFQVNNSGAIAAATGIISSGTIQFTGLGTGVVQSDNTGTLTSAALNLGGGSQYITGILPVLNGGSPFEETTGAITERIPTEDLLLGATATASAKFGFLNVNSGTPTASISGTNHNATTLTANGVLATTNAQSLQLGNASTGNINFFSGANNLTSAGNLTLANNLSIGGISAANTTNTINGLSINAATQTLSAHQIADNGTLTITTGTNSNLFLTPNGSGNTILTSTYQSGVLIGSVSNTIAPLSVSGGIGNNAAAIINQTNSGDIFTASSAGATKFTISNNGNVGIGTSTPLAPLDVQGIASVSGNLILANGPQSIQTQANQQLTIGGNTTGTISLQPNAGTGTLDLEVGALSVNGAAGVTNGSASCVTTTNGIVTGVATCVIDNTVSPFAAANGSIFERNTTEDFLLGATATGSAKFAVTNINSGTPTASLSAANNNATYLTATGTLSTTNAQTLILGGGSTGNITISPASTTTINGTTIFSGLGLGIAHISSTGVLSSSAVNLASGDVTGILPILNGGSPFEQSNGAITERITTQDFLLGGTSTASAKFAFTNVNSGTPTASISAQSGGGALSLTPTSLTTQNAQTLTIGGTNSGNIIIAPGGTSALTALPNGNVGIGTTAPASLLSVGNTSQFQVNSSGAIAAATGIISSGTIQFSALGTGVVQSSSNGTLSSAALNLAGGTQYISGILPVINGGSPFEETNGAITERIPTEDLLLGGTATASSKFAFTNVNSGTPTASISGANNNALSLTATGNLGTTNAQTLTLGGAATGNILLNSQGTPSLTIAGTTVTNAGTFTSTGLITANGGVTLPTGQFITLNGLTQGSVLYVNGSSQVIGTTGTTHQILHGGTAPTFGAVDLTQDVSGILPVTNGGSPFDEANGAIVERLSTEDVLLGNNASASAEIGFLNIGAGTPTVSLFNGTNNTLLSSNGILSTTGNEILTLGSALTGNIILSPTGANNVGIGFNGTPLASLDVRGSLGTTPTASISGKSSFANLVVDQSGTGDLITASKSGATKFTITNAGTLQFSGGSNFLQTITSTATQLQTLNIPTLSQPTADFCFTTGNCAGAGSSITGHGTATQIAFFDANQNIVSSPDLYFDNVNNRLGLGTSTPFGTLDVQASTIAAPVASLSGATSYASLVVDQSGTGDIITGSNSGATKFTITNNGTLQFAGGSSFLQTITSTATQQQTLNIPELTSPNADFCFTTGNCAGAGAGITGHGTATQLAFFDANQDINSSPNLYFDNVNNRLGLGTSTPVSTLDVRNTSGAGPTASFSGATTSVGLLVDQSGTGDIFAASESGATKFVVYNNGNLGIAGSTNTLTTLTSLATSPQTIALPNESGTVCLEGSSNCGFATTGQNYWQLNDNLISPVNNVYDFAIGGTSTTSAKFAFVNNLTGTPTATFSAGNNNNTYLTASGNLGTTNAQTLTIGGNSTGNIVLNSGSNTIQLANNNIQFTGSAPIISSTGTLTINAFTLGGTLTAAGNSIVNISSATFGTGNLSLSNNTIAGGSNGDLILTPNGANNTVLTTTYQSGVKIGSSSNTIAPLSVTGGIGGNAAAIINQTNSGDIFTASAAGNTKFTIANNGNLTATGSITGLQGITSAGNIQFTGLSAVGIVHTDINGNLSTSAVNLAGGPTEVTGTLPVLNGGSPFTEGNGAIFERLQTQDLLLGSNATSSAKFAFTNVTSGVPTASISAGSGNNAAYLTGSGVLGTTNGQSLTLGSTGNINFFSSANVLTSTGNLSLAGNLNLGGTIAANTTDTINGLSINSATQTLSAHQIADSGTLTITGGTNSNVNITPNGSGNTILSSTFQSGVLIGSSSNSLAPLSVSGGIGGNAATIINQTNSGDIFTASASGVTAFTIANNGNLQATGTITGLTGITSNGQIQFSGFTSNGGPLYTNGTGVLAQTPAGNANQVLHGGTTPTFSSVDLTQDVSNTLPVGNGGTGLTTYNQGDLLYGNNTHTLSTLPIGTENQLLSISAGGIPVWVTSSAFNFFQKQDGVISPLNTSDDFILGSASTASAKFAFVNNAAGTPTASISAQNGSGSALSLNPNSITTQNGQTLTLGGTTTGNVQIVSGGTTALTAQGTNLVAAGTLTGLQGLTSAGTITFSGIGGTGIVHSDTNGVLSSSAVNLASGDITGILPIANGGSPFEQNNLGAITERITTQDLLLGGTSTASAKFAFENVAGGTPTASISGTGNNALSLTGDGTLGTTNGQTLQLGNASTGNVQIVSGSTVDLTALPNGNVGIGTTAPTSLFSVGNSSQFQINSSGAIAAATGIISSGTIQFTGLGTGVVQSDNTGTLTSAALNLPCRRITIHYRHPSCSQWWLSFQ